MATARSTRGAASALLALLGACAAPAEFTNRPPEPLAWPAPDAVPRVELEFAYGRTSDAVRHPGFWSGLLRVFVGEEQAQLVSPTGLCAQGEVLWIADAGAACVHRLSLDSGEHLVLRGHDEHPFHTPVGVAAAPDGRVYVSDAGNAWITVLDDDGRAERCFGGPEVIGRPTGVCYDAERERLLVVDTTGCRLLAFAPDGALRASVGERGTEPGQFNFPTNLAQASDGRVVVVDSMNFRVQVLTPDLRPLHAFGRVGRGPGDFANPKGVALDTADHVYVVDSMFDNFQIFDLQGQLLLAVASTGQGHGQLYLPTGIHIDRTDRIFVADAGNSRVHVMRLHGGAP
ncbi:MAG: hypothetical protein AB7O97_00495 [Planctomycetota bacterium]